MPCPRSRFTRKTAIAICTCLLVSPTGPCDSPRAHPARTAIEGLIGAISGPERAVCPRARPIVTERRVINRVHSGRKAAGRSPAAGRSCLAPRPWSAAQWLIGAVCYAEGVILGGAGVHIAVDILLVHRDSAGRRIIRQGSMCRCVEIEDKAVLQLGTSGCWLLRGDY